MNDCEELRLRWNAAVKAYADEPTEANKAHLVATRANFFDAIFTPHVEELMELQREGRG